MDIKTCNSEFRLEVGAQEQSRNRLDFPRCCVLSRINMSAAPHGVREICPPPKDAAFRGREKHHMIGTIVISAPSFLTACVCITCALASTKCLLWGRLEAGRVGPLRTASCPALLHGTVLCNFSLVFLIP
jgi:hypothetical protein